MHKIPLCNIIQHIKINLHIICYKSTFKEEYNMCGIVGYIGNKKVSPILIQGLTRLEYRGYDSAGIAVMEGNKIEIKKDKGVKTPSCRELWRLCRVLWYARDGGFVKRFCENRRFAKISGREDHSVLAICSTKADKIHYSRAGQTAERRGKAQKWVLTRRKKRVKLQP